MPEICQCCDCFKFIPDSIGSGHGIGKCSDYESLKKLGASKKKLETAYILLGNKLFWAGKSDVPDRYCERFQSKNASHAASNPNAMHTNAPAVLAASKYSICPSSHLDNV